MPRGGVLLALIGELDLRGTDEVIVAFERVARPPCRVVLDLSRLHFLDVTGLRAIMAGLARVRRAGCELEVRSELTRPVRRVIEVLGAGGEIWPQTRG